MDSKQQVFSQYAEYYNSFYAEKDYASEAKYVHSLLKQNNPECKNILELGCGTGKHAGLLYGLGYSIQGIDLSNEMIEIAKKDEGGGLAFEQGDVRTYRDKNKYDAVISLFHVASYQTSNKDICQFLQSARYHLEPGGLLIFDFWYGPAVLTDPPSVRVRSVETENYNIKRTAHPQMLPSQNKVNVHYEILLKDKISQQLNVIEEIHSMRYFFFPELELMLEQASFKTVNFYEWMKHTEPGFNSWYAIIAAKAI